MLEILMLIYLFLVVLCFIGLYLNDRRYFKSREKYIEWVASDWDKIFKNK